MVHCGYEIFCEFWLDEYDIGFVVGYNKNKNEYVVWEWNKNHNYYYFGHYTSTKNVALKKFKDLINYTLNKITNNN